MPRPELLPMVLTGCRERQVSNFNIVPVKYPSKNANYKKYQALYKRKKYYEEKSQIFSLLGDVCCTCGFYDGRALHIDHVNGLVGRKRDKTGSYYRNILNQIIDGSKEYQILCANCNMIKKVENNEFSPRKYT